MTTAIALSVTPASIATAGTSAAAPAATAPVQPNIVGGNAPSLPYPPGAFVAVGYDAPAYGVYGHFTCTSSQLSGFYVRLAAHCVDDPPANLTVDARARLLRSFGMDPAAAKISIPTAAKRFWIRLGSPDRTRGGTFVYATIAWKEPHWSWLQNPGDADDAAELRTAQYVDTYALPIAPRPAQPGDTVYELGWGLTEPAGDGVPPTKIRELRTTVIPADRCAPAGITAREICVENRGGFAGACYGDSGGPLILVIDGVLYDAGIMSRSASDPCGVAPDVYTSTPEFAAELYAAMIGQQPNLAHGTPIR